MSTTAVATTWRDGLSRSDRAILEKLAEGIKGHLGRAIEPMFLAGRDLTKARAILGDEQPWIEWLEQEFKPGFRTTAWRLMTLAEKLQKPYEKGLLLQFATSAAYELTAPGAPPQALARAVAEAEAGEEITRDRAKEIIAEQKEEERLAAEEAVEQLPPAAQQRIRQQARAKALRDARAKKLEAIERHLKAARALMDGEPDISDDLIALLDDVLESCREALA
jgi:hypothetical protein